MRDHAGAGGLVEQVLAHAHAVLLGAHVYLVAADSQMQFRTVAKHKKDFLPMKLMQYGAVQFPRGELEELWCYPVAVKKVDGSALKLEYKTHR